MFVAGLPFELSEEIKQTFLFTPRDELLKRFGYGRLFGSLPTDLPGAFDELGIDREIGSHDV